MVTEQKAEYVGAPKYTGITIPPPTASEGFKAEDIEELGLHEDDNRLVGSEGADPESMGNSFGMLLIVVLVVAIAIFALKMLAH
ncbi:MAG: hypothetical protein KGR26_02150 [Cyanobacteria bacterium REEB65]|nr:hypothetical protein [Cyanobacteria bacterium REEB65]